MAWPFPSAPTNIPRFGPLRTVAGTPVVPQNQPPPDTRLFTSPSTGPVASSVSSGSPPNPESRPTRPHIPQFRRIQAATPINEEEYVQSVHRMEEDDGVIDMGNFLDSFGQFLGVRRARVPEYNNRSSTETSTHICTYQRAVGWAKANQLKANRAEGASTGSGRGGSCTEHSDNSEGVHGTSGSSFSPGRVRFEPAMAVGGNLNPSTIRRPSTPHPLSSPCKAKGGRCGVRRMLDATIRRITSSGSHKIAVENLAELADCVYAQTRKVSAPIHGAV